MKSDQKEEETVLDLEIDEFDIEEMTEKFRKWIISNRDRFLVDFENPKGKLKQDEKTFHLRFHDDYSLRLSLRIEVSADVEFQRLLKGTSVVIQSH